MKNLFAIVIIGIVLTGCVTKEPDFAGVNIFDKKEIVIPCVAETKTQKDFNNTKYVFLKKKIINHFARFANNKSNWYNDTEKFLDKFCKYYSDIHTSKELEQLINTGKNLIEKIYSKENNTYCKTNIIKVVYGLLLLENKQYSEAEKYLKSCEKKLINEKVSKYFLAIIADNILKMNMSLYEHNKDYYSKTINAISEFLKSDEYNDDCGRIALNLIEESNISNEYNVFEIKEKILKKITKKDKLNNWIKLVLSADIDINNAWKIRTHAYSIDVTDKMRKGFHENIELAYPKYVKAWKLRPEYPSPPARMIEVARIHKNPFSMELWFNRCMQAQIDYKPAYTFFFWYNQRWTGGSFSKAQNIGIAAFKTKRFDTQVPMYYIRSIMTYATEYNIVKKRFLFRNQQVKQIINYIFKSYEKQDLSKQERNLLLRKKIVIKIFMGDYEEAKEIFNNLDLKENSFTNLFPNSKDQMHKYNTTIDDIKTELKAFTGKYKNEFSQWEWINSISKSTRNHNDVENILDVVKDDPKLYQYALNMIGFLKLDLPLRRRYMNCSALYLATLENKIDVINYLVQKGANIHQQTIHELTPLMVSLRDSTKNNISKILIKNGNNFNLKDCGDWTPLMFASKYSTPEIIKLLIAKGAKINDVNSNGWTPLMFATKYSTLEIVKLLVANNADVSLKTKNGKTILDIAKELNREKIIKLLTPTTQTFKTKALQMFELVWKEVSKYQKDSKEINLINIYSRYLQKIENCSSERQLISIINNMLKEFKQSHLALLPPENKEVTKALQISTNAKISSNSNIKDMPSDIGVRLCLTNDNKICVLKVAQNSSGYEVGIEVGDIIKRINNYKFNTNIKTRINWDAIAQGMLEGLENTKVTITIEKPNKKIKKLSVKMRSTGERWIQSGYMPKLLGKFYFEILKSNIGYIYFTPCFSQQIIQFQNAIKNMPDIKGLIIDVRNNPGGMIMTPTAISGWLSDKEIKFGKMNSNGTILTLNSYPQQDAFTGPIAILTNPGTGSASEVFAAGMQDNKRAVIVGETTAGQCLPSIFLKLENNFRLQTVFGSLTRHNGEEIEQIGVIPNIKCQVKYSDLIKGKDTILEQGIIAIIKNIDVTKEKK